MTVSKNPKIYLSIFFSFTVLVFLYYPTSGLTLSHFHNDDTLLLGRLSKLTDFYSAINYIFNLDCFKFRPIANIQYLIEYFLFGDNYNAYVLYNICLVLILIYVFLLFFYDKASLLACLMLSLILGSSKFLVYSVWNITGSFETLSAIIFLLIVFLIYNVNISAKKTVAFLALLLILTSEKYLPFLLTLPIIYHYNRSPKNFFESIIFGIKYSVTILVAYFAFRYFSGIPLIIGTETDNISESFSAIRFFSHVLKSYLEILGFSPGPKYLTGFEFVDWAPFNVLINDSIYIWGFFISLSLLVASLYYFLFKSYFKIKAAFTFNLIGFLSILAASITFRVELRWLLPSYLMLLLLFSTCRSFETCDTACFNIKLFDRTLFVSIIVFSILNNFYYAIFFRRGLYFAEKLHDSSLVAFFWAWLQG